MKRIFAFLVLIAVLATMTTVHTDFGQMGIPPISTGEEALDEFKSLIVPELIQIAIDLGIKEKLRKREEETPVYDVMAFAYQQAVQRINTRRLFFTEWTQTAPVASLSRFVDNAEVLRAEIIFQFCLWSLLPNCPKSESEQALAANIRRNLMRGSLQRLLLSLAFQADYFTLAQEDVVRETYSPRMGDFIDVEAFQQAFEEITQIFEANGL